MFTLPPRAARALILLLCTLVLGAQQAGLTHVVWHAAAQATQPHGADADERERAPTRELASLCAFDAAFAQVLGAGGTASDSGFTHAAISGSVVHRDRACLGVEALTPRSRGPPVTL
jgi:hypothetical protein